MNGGAPHSFGFRGVRTRTRSRRRSVGETTLEENRRAAPTAQCRGPPPLAARGMPPSLSGRGPKDFPSPLFAGRGAPRRPSRRAFDGVGDQGARGRSESAGQEPAPGRYRGVARRATSASSSGLRPDDEPSPQPLAREARASASPVASNPREPYLGLAAIFRNVRTASLRFARGQEGRATSSPRAHGLFRSFDRARLWRRPARVILSWIPAKVTVYGDWGFVDAHSGLAARGAFFLAGAFLATAVSISRNFSARWRARWRDSISCIWIC